MSDYKFLRVTKGRGGAAQIGWPAHILDRLLFL